MKTQETKMVKKYATQRKKELLNEIRVLQEKLILLKEVLIHQPKFA
ncbi:MAG: hypothetical protein HXX81_00390 [Campylobacterales bacterium]|nr:hypothetical protein [Campylobacterales bacterium]